MLDYLIDNWLWILLVGAFFVLHLRMHGGHGGHGGRGDGGGHGGGCATTAATHGRTSEMTARPPTTRRTPDSSPSVGVR